MTDVWPELTREMQGFFAEFDVNNTGKLAVEEITAILKSVGLRCTPDEAREMMSEVAGPNEVAITCDQLMEILRRHTHQEDEDQTIEQAFRIIDVDGDGLISADDLQCFMLSLGEDFDAKYAERMLKAATGGQSARPVALEDYKRTLKSKWANAPQSS
jgi:Ca2+-binding EF-hand superfamily protein